MSFFSMSDTIVLLTLTLVALSLRAEKWQHHVLHRLLSPSQKILLFFPLIQMTGWK